MGLFERKFGAFVGVTGLLAALLTLHTLRRWNELGMIDRGVVSLIWIAIFASAAAIAVTIWRYARARRERRRMRSTS
ncbi:MAG TPA: hypothetical protein VEH77_18960 [Roseiarcus sp.]|nr:hypothetical protein [Roseiarcus sp.]